MHNDDRPVGRFLSRRELVTMFGAAASGSALARRVSAGPAEAVGGPAEAGLYAAGGPAEAGFYAAGGPAEAGLYGGQLGPDCVAQPRQTEGPYFVDERLLRSDIRSDSTTGRSSGGAPLELRFEVQEVTAGGACAAMPGAQFDIWHCDAGGVYSDVQDRSVDTTGQNFLRGHQVSDAQGRVRFTTIYPGWYSGRAVHIHFKIRRPVAGGRTDEFTSQLYFDDALTDRVHAREPYRAHKGQRLVNERDMIFREGGAQLLLPVVEAGEDGFAATFRIAMRPGESDPAFRPGGGRGRGLPPRRL